MGVYLAMFDSCRIGRPKNGGWPLQSAQILGLILIQAPNPKLAQVNASMLQTHAITDNIMTRSLPASFESASEWPECAEITMRIHNQGGICRLPSPIL